MPRALGGRRLAEGVCAVRHCSSSSGGSGTQKPWWLFLTAGAAGGAATTYVALNAATSPTTGALSPERRAHAHHRVLYVMRGPPGSGKSTLGREILREHLAASGVTGGVEHILPLARSHIFSTDDFFAAIDEETGKEVYNFDFRRLGPNHDRNKTHCEIAMELGITPLIVDNTNASAWEMRPYVELAKKHGYAVEIKDVFQLHKDAMNLDVLKKRCAERDAPGKVIPEVALQRILGRYERLPEDREEAEAFILKAEAPQRRPPPKPAASPP